MVDSLLAENVITKPYTFLAALCNPSRILYYWALVTVIQSTFALRPLWICYVSIAWLFVFPQTYASAETIGGYWDQIYSAETAPAVHISVPKAPPQPTSPEPEFANPLDYVTIRAGLSYTRNLTTFNDRATRTFSRDCGPLLSAAPDGICFPGAFRETANRLTSYLSVGTRGYGSSRLSTYVSLVSYHDLNDTRNGSPYIDTLDGLNGGNRTDVISAYADINGLAKEGPLSRVQLRVGRQFAFDFDSLLLGSAVIDGASFRTRTERSELTAFFGWRESFFADPASEFTLGGSWTYRLRSKTKAHVDFIQYQSSQRYAFGLQHQFKHVSVDSHISFIQTDPIEFSSRASYSAPDSPWSVYASFLQQLSANDFIYDIWFTSKDKDRSRRLNFGRINPSSQFRLEVDRQIFWWLSAGVGGWMRFLNDGSDQRAFDTAFQEINARLLFTPFPQWDYSVQYRFRHNERGPARTATLFDDISRSGLTSYQEFNAEARYRWHDWARITVGGYFRLFDAQSRLVRLNSVDNGGMYTSLWLRVTDYVDLRFEYGMDSDYREYNPAIDLVHTFRMSVDFHYN